MRKSLLSTLLFIVFITSASAQVRQTNLYIDNGSGTLASLVATGLTGGRTITMPDASGKLSLTTSAGATLFTGPTVARTFTLPDVDATLVSTNTLNNNSLAGSLTSLTINSLSGGGQLIVQADNSGVLSASNTLAADLDMGTTHRIHNLATPTSNLDAANKDYVDNATIASVTGTANSIPVFTDVHVLGNSVLTDNNTTFAINTNKFTVTESNGNTAAAGTFSAESETLSPTGSDIGLNIVNTGSGFDIQGSGPWDVDNTGGASFQTLSLIQPLAVNQGGTHSTSLAGNGVLEMNSGGTTVTSNLLTDGQIIVGFTGSAPVHTVLTGDGSIDNAGLLTISSYGGGANAFDDMATQNSNSVNITGGTLSSVTLNLNVLGSHQTTAPAISTGGAHIADITSYSILTHSTDAAGQITFTTDGGLQGDNSTYIEVDFVATTPDPIVVISPADDGAASELTGFYVVGTGGAPGYFRIYIGTSWIDFAQTITLNYHVINIQ